MSYTVLLVDDEPNFLDGLQRALRKEPYLILTATSAEIALEILRMRAVDLVVSDYEMPGMQGTAFLAQVQQEFPEIMLFMLTGKATPEIAVQAINDGAISHFFTKPCDMVALAFKQTLHQRTSMMTARRLRQKGKCQATPLEHVEHHAPDITQVGQLQGAATPGKG
jgi:two-component system, probable response regulator PhcQ